MHEHVFQQLAEEEWVKVPTHFARQVTNVALLIEDEPSDTVRQEEELAPEETLLGLYQGIPLSERGSDYGVGVTMPDTITLYRMPIMEEASEMDRAFPEALRIVIRETLWHELGHYFGLPEGPINEREDEGTNVFPTTPSDSFDDA